MFHGDYELVLRDGQTLPLSRRYKALLPEAIRERSETVPGGSRSARNFRSSTCRMRHRLPLGMTPAVSYGPVSLLRRYGRTPG